MIDFTFQNKVLITCEEQRLEEELFFLTDLSIFDVFTLPFIKGDPGTALEEPYSLVITEEMAEKYFGEQDPLGKILTLNNTFDFKITGVLKNIPANSHLRFNFLAPMGCADDLHESILKIPVSLGSWRNFNCHTYLLLPKDYDPAELENKMPLFLQKHHSDGAHSTDFLKIYLQPLAKIHLYSDFDSGTEITGDIKYIYLFSVIAFFILLIACINFMNLSTARFANRAKEVG
ncbi:MAG: ABC transporter permease, partial [bacterium]